MPPCSDVSTHEPVSTKQAAAAPPLQAGHDTTGLHFGIAPQPPLELVELEDTIEPGEHDQAAKILYYDVAGDELWNESDRNLETACDPQQGLFLAGERHLAFFHPGSGQHLPVPGVRFHLAKTDAAISPGGSGSVQVWRVDGGTPGDSSFRVTAHDWLGQGIAADKACYVFQHLQSKLWYAVYSSVGNSGAARFGVCQSNWSYEGHFPSHPDFDPATDFAFVTVKQCGDRFGADVTGSDLTVALLPNSKGDPNLVAGDVISFVDMPDRSLVCVSEYMDDAIGTVKMFDLPDVPLRPGWQCMSEMEAEGGRFPLGTCSDGQMGETGGTLSHNHGGNTGAAGGHDHSGATGQGGAHNHGGETGTGGEHDHDGFTGYATADITIANHSTVDVADCIKTHTAAEVAATLTDHTAHIHTLPSNYRAADGEPQILVYSDEFLTTPDFDYPLTEAGPQFNHRKHFGTEAGGLLHQGAPDPSDELSLLHTITEPNEGTGHKHAINQHYGHTHTISQQAAHTHAITAEGNHQHTIAGVSHLNPYYKIKFIRRIDNAA